MKKQLFLIAIVSVCVCIALASMSHQQVGTSLRNTLMGQPKASADGTAPTMNLAYTPTYTSGTKNWVTETTPFNITTTDGFDEPFTGYGNGNNVTGTGAPGQWNTWDDRQYCEKFGYTNGVNISTSGGCASWNNWNPWHAHGNGAPVEYSFSESSGMGYYNKNGSDSSVSYPIYKPATAQSSYPGMLGIKFQCNAWPSGGSIEFEFDNSAVSTIETRVYICANGSLQVSNGVSHPVTVIEMSLSTSYNFAIDAISSTKFDVIVDSTVYDNGGSHFNTWSSSTLMGALLIGYSAPVVTGGVYISSIWTEWHCSSGAGGPSTQHTFFFTQTSNGIATFNKYANMGMTQWPDFTFTSAATGVNSVGFAVTISALPKSLNNPGDDGYEFSIISSGGVQWMEQVVIGANGTIFAINNNRWFAICSTGVISGPTTFTFTISQTSLTKYSVSVYNVNTGITSTVAGLTNLGGQSGWNDIVFLGTVHSRCTGAYQLLDIWASWIHSQVAGYGLKITGSGHTTGNVSGAWSNTVFTQAQWYVPSVQGLHFTLAGVLNTYGNGTYTIQYCSWDFAGNNETLLARIVYIDTIGPITSISFTPEYTSGGKYWINSSTLITLTGVDNPGGSGAPYTFYNWTGPTNHGWALNSAPFTLTNATINGTYVITFFSIDNMGNVAAVMQWTPVFVDTQVPTTSISYNSSFTAGQKTWVRNNTLYTFTANDGVGSGVDETWAKVNGTDYMSWTHITGPFTLVGIINGTYTISWCSWDNVGNNESLQSKLLFVDAIAPTTTIIQPIYLYTKTVPYTKNFTSGSATFALNAMDNPGGSGVKYTSYRITANGVAGPVYNYSTPFTLGSSANGTYTITWWSVDNIGNAETMHSLTAYIDSAPPVTTIIQPSYIYNSGSKNFTTGGATFVLSPVDDSGSGVAFTQFRVNGGTWVSGTSFSINSYWGITITNGTYTITWNSTDNVGHVEGTHHITVYIDTTPPATTIVEPTYLYNSGSKKFTTGIAMFALNAQDNVGGSRVLTMSYGITINGVAGTWTSYTGPFMLSSSVNGTFSISWYSKDNAENVETTHSITVYIDMIAPNTTISFKKASAPDHVNSSTTFALTVQDNAGGSGVASIQYQYTGSSGGWISYSTPFTLPNKQNGTVMIMYRAIDNVGNVEMTGNVTVYLVVLVPPPSFWDTYGTYIIIAAIGVAIIAIIGSVAASKKKKSARARTLPDKTIASKKKSIENYQPVQASTPAAAIIAPQKVPPTQVTVPAPIEDFNLFCPACEQWYPRPAGTVISGSELCSACSRPLSFVPKCDACGNGMIKPVSEFNAFVNSDRACNQCGKQMRIQ